MLEPGAVVDGFHLDEPIARSQTADIWSARDRAGGRVVLKLLLAELSEDRAWVARFEREARLLANVRSDHVTTLLAAGRVTGKGRPYLAFAARDGETVAHRLHAKRVLPLGELSPLVRDCLFGLIAVHDAGILHRDVKPENVFLERAPDGSERAVLIDFGVGQSEHDDLQGLTSAHATVGTLAFMAPEQYQASRKLDARVDVYALGTLVFLALTGRLPFEARTLDALVALKLEKDAPSLAEVTGREWPTALERFVRRALARLPSRRIASATDALRLWRAATSEPALAPAISAPIGGEMEPSTLASPARSKGAWRR